MADLWIEAVADQWIEVRTDTWIEVTRLFRLLHVTAKGSDEDCVSRSFAPKLAVREDPVCGSGHCHIIPYWAYKLGKDELVAFQASQRGGTLYCRKDGKKDISSRKGGIVFC